MSKKRRRNQRKLSEAPAPRGGTQKQVELGDLDGFAAERLDWPLVRELFERHCSTSLGRRALRRLEPRGDEAAAAALARVAELADRFPVTGEAPLGDLNDPMPLIEGAERSRMALSETDLGAVLDFLRAVVRTTVWYGARRDALPLNAELVADLPELEPLRARLEAGLDGRGGVRDQASARLAKLRDEVRKLTQRIEKRAKALANRPELKGALADGLGGRVSLRDGRPVLAVKAKHAGRVRGMVHDRSGSGETLFVEPAELIEDGNALSTARADEQREVQRLLTEWTRDVLQAKAPIAETAGRLSEVELAIVGRRFCEAFGARVPELPSAASGDVLVLREARHPLLADQERAGKLDECVPIDLRLGDPFDVLVITGPNTGGKTLALKTAGLAVLLARLGLPFPCAKGSVVPLMRGIVADIGDEQEVAQSLSTFSSHLVRIAEGLPRASPRTLFLLDELGGGTDPADGAALGAALLDWLRVRRVPTLASTHIGALKEFAFRHPTVENACVEFDLETLQPLYRLVVGTPGESRALSIARRLGFDPAILADAEQRVARPEHESAKLMDEMRTARVEAERSRSLAAERALEADARLADLARDAERLDERRELLATEAQSELEQRLAPARAHVDRARALLAQLGKEQRAVLEPVLDELAGSLGSASLTDRRKEFLDGLRKGDLVWVPRYKKRCPVLRIDRDRGRLKLRLGRQELELDLDDVSSLESA